MGPCKHGSNACVECNLNETIGLILDETTNSQKSTMTDLECIDRVIELMTQEAREDYQESFMSMLKGELDGGDIGEMVGMWKRRIEGLRILKGRIVGSQGKGPSK